MDGHNDNISSSNRQKNNNTSAWAYKALLLWEKNNVLLFSQARPTLRSDYSSHDSNNNNDSNENGYDNDINNKKRNWRKAVGIANDFASTPLAVGSTLLGHDRRIVC